MGRWGSEGWQSPWAKPPSQGLGALQENVTPARTFSLSDPPLVPGMIPQGDFPQFLTRVSRSQLGSCREWMDASLEVILPLLSPQQANHFCGLFWDPFHFCDSLGYAEQKGQTTPLQNETITASRFPSLICTSSFFSWWSCLWRSRRSTFCFALFLCLLLHMARLSASCPQFQSLPPPPTTATISVEVLIHTSALFAAGALPALSVALPPNMVLCVLQGGGSAGLLAQMHGRNSF